MAWAFSVGRPHDGDRILRRYAQLVKFPQPVKGHNAILEDVEGLSRSRLIPYLRWLFSKFVPFIDENADGDDVNVIPHLSDDVVLDRPISEQLNAARLVAVDVFRRAKSSNIDKALPYYEKQN